MISEREAYMEPDPHIPSWKSDGFSHQTGVGGIVNYCRYVRIASECTTVSEMPSNREGLEDRRLRVRYEAFSQSRAFRVTVLPETRPIGTYHALVLPARPRGNRGALTH